MIDDPNKAQDKADDKARGRFMVLQMLRLSGVALVVIGLLCVNGRLVMLGLPAIAGYAFIVAGVLDSFVMPAVLARSWKSPLE
jgi:predicted anti-sigma-YlaC factor YlaD